MRSYQITLFVTFVLGYALCSVPTAQIEALTEFYESTNGDYWKNNGSWLDGDPCDNNWFGVMCNMNRDGVTYLILQGNNVTGMLPSSFTNINTLNGLVFPQNSLYGGIPDVYNSLPIVHIDFSMNQLTGELPNWNNISLSQIFLQYNDLSGYLSDNIPFEVSIGECNIEHNDWNCPLPQWCNVTSPDFRCDCGSCIPSPSRTPSNTPSKSITSSITKSISISSSNSESSSASISKSDSPSNTPTSSRTKSISVSSTRTPTPTTTNFNFSNTFYYELSESVYDESSGFFDDDDPKYGLYAIIIVVVIIIILSAIVVIGCFAKIIKKKKANKSNVETKSLLEQ